MIKQIPLYAQLETETQTLVVAHSPCTSCIILIVY